MLRYNPPLSPDEQGKGVDSYTEERLKLSKLSIDMPSSKYCNLSLTLEPKPNTTNVFFSEIITISD
jgi:hypothetical protein